MVKLWVIGLLVWATGSQVQASVSEGKRLWYKPQIINGQERSCTTCHGLDPTLPGRHQRTLKLIEPMSQKINNKRFKSEKKVEKWFKRNCKWAWGRECTSQEKSDILMFLLAE